MSDLYLTRKGLPDQRYERRDKHLAALVKLLSKPRSIAQIMSALGVGKRAVYLFFDDLGERGLTVARVGPRSDGKWFLLRDKPKK